MTDLLPIFALLGVCIFGLGLTIRSALHHYRDGGGKWFW